MEILPQHSVIPYDWKNSHPSAAHARAAAAGCQCCNVFAPRHRHTHKHSDPSKRRTAVAVGCSSIKASTANSPWRGSYANPQRFKRGVEREGRRR